MYSIASSSNSFIFGDVRLKKILTSVIFLNVGYIIYVYINIYLRIVCIPPNHVMRALDIMVEPVWFRSDDDDNDKNRIIMTNPNSVIFQPTLSRDTERDRSL